MQQRAANQPRHVLAALAPRALLELVQVSQALQVSALLPAKQRAEPAVGHARGDQELHVDLLVKLLRSGLRFGDPGVESLAPSLRQPVLELAPVAPLPHRLHEAVALEALERRIDLADIDFPGLPQHRLKPVLPLVAVQRFLREEAQHAELKRHWSRYPYSVCIGSMHGAARKSRLEAFGQKKGRRRAPLLSPSTYWLLG